MFVSFHFNSKTITTIQNLWKSASNVFASVTRIDLYCSRGTAAILNSDCNSADWLESQGQHLLWRHRMKQGQRAGDLRGDVTPKRIPSLHRLWAAGCVCGGGGCCCVQYVSLAYLPHWSFIWLSFVHVVAEVSAVWLLCIDKFMALSVVLKQPTDL